ncbi:hypothetical protein C8Q74DRAFT_1271700 [Fomes fomentarius]|nr:hypothetical protein C8Q74DRAFT_1271700 [Fomes fomentarius]
MTRTCGCVFWSGYGYWRDEAGNRELGKREEEGRRANDLPQELSAKINRSIEQQVAAAASSGKLTIMKNVAMEGYVYHFCRCPPQHTNCHPLRSSRLLLKLCEPRCVDCPTVLHPACLAFSFSFCGFTQHVGGEGQREREGEGPQAEESMNPEYPRTAMHWRCAIATDVRMRCLWSSLHHGEFRSVVDSCVISINYRA